MTDNDVKILAAIALMDGGIALPLNTIFGIRRINIKIPTINALVRISEIVEKSDFKKNDSDELKDRLEFIKKYSKPVSCIISSCICRSTVSYKCFGKLIAWILRDTMSPLYMYEAYAKIVQTINTSPFENIMELTQTMNKLQPTEKRS